MIVAGTATVRSEAMSELDAQGLDVTDKVRLILSSTVRSAV